MTQSGAAKKTFFSATLYNIHKSVRAKALPVGPDRLCSATFEQLLAFGATFSKFSNFEQLLVF